jgi:cell division protein FtsB
LAKPPSIRAGRSTASDGGARRVGARLLWWVAGIVVLVYVVQGGEYSTTDLLRQRAKERALHAEIVSLHRSIDSLKALEHAIATDPAVQERIAREEFGMVSGHKELLYRFAAPDSARP